MSLKALFRPICKPFPLISASAGGLLLAASLSSSAIMSTSHATWPVTKYQPRHQSWPYDASDFTRQDPSSDSSFYSAPRFVTHIDDAAIASLREYYDAALPRKGRILDFCSSWISHYPPGIEDSADRGDLKVTGLGMSRAELAANKVLNSGRIVKDLNDDPDIYSTLLEAQIISKDSNTKLDASTNVVSTDYLTRPVEVLKSLREATKPGGTVHLVISNRCFPTKAINRWLHISEEERTLMVGDFLHFAGWSQIEIIDLSNGKLDAKPPQAASQNRLQDLMGWVRMSHRDPLWVVRAVATYSGEFEMPQASVSYKTRVTLATSPR